MNATTEHAPPNKIGHGSTTDTEPIANGSKKQASNERAPLRVLTVPSLALRAPTLRSPALAVVAVAALLSIASFAYFYNRNATNFYGDGIAHVNIARKVVDHPDDSLWQRYIQIGSPWLPLQTALMLPLVANDWMWRTGVAGSLVSMIAYVIAALALYKLANQMYRAESEPYKTALPVVAAAIFLLNPSLLYLQTTPMTEAVFMAALVSAVYLLQRWADDQSRRRLAVAAIVMSAATLARYEAWPVAALAAPVIALVTCSSPGARFKNAAIFSAIAATGPVYWLWHNWAIYGDALWFVTGPYSARGVYLQNQANLGWSKIFVGHAALDVLLMTATVAVCVGPLVMILAAVGLGWLIKDRRSALIRLAPVMLLFVPFFFHALSLYRGEIQIFPLSAFGLLNVRYGLPHLLGLALIAPAAALLLGRIGKSKAIAVVSLIVAAQYWLLISDGPSQLAIFQEGFRNGVNARPARARERVAFLLKDHPPQPVILMHTSSLGPVVSKGGLRFSDLIHEGASRWHQIEDRIPSDVKTIIIEEGDPLDKRLRERASLSRDLAEHFQEQFSAGKIKLYRRVSGAGG